MFGNLAIIKNYQLRSFLKKSTLIFVMRYAIICILVFLNTGITKSQDADTFMLHLAMAQTDTIVFKRIIQFDKFKNLFHVRDYYDNGQIQMDAFYSSFDRNVKEEYQCNYLTNTKEGAYTQWYSNGQTEFSGFFKNGRLNSHSASWYRNGKIEAIENWSKGQLHGRVKYWTKNGDLQYDLKFSHGQNNNPIDENYKYLTYLPENYKADTLKRWPLIIYLHGGSDRGSDLKKLYSSGIPDQVYRGRKFPFIIISPQCPEHIRWSTENWFEDFFDEVIMRYRIDTNRVYLTGLSLGGAGTWYLAAKYPEKFAAIAPISGFTSNMDFIDENLDKVTEIPVWAFHGKIDIVVPFEETERIINKLEGKNSEVKFSAEPLVGHWIHWLVYPGQELYDWFLKHEKQ
jgi:hypothetical protein